MPMLAAACTSPPPQMPLSRNASHDKGEGQSRESRDEHITASESTRATPRRLMAQPPPSTPRRTYMHAGIESAKKKNSQFAGARTLVDEHKRAKMPTGVHPNRGNEGRDR